MAKITDKKGELKLTVRKIIVMTFLVMFFTVVAKRWEFKRRREFKKSVKYKSYDTDYLKKVLEDFKILSSCKDPYIENFYKKHPDFSTLHKLWVLNSFTYWTEKFNKELRRRNEKAA
ncbi:MAG: hypothetical protein ACOX3U_02345 [Christensenellales bacterium]|jgi:hypothetical protein